MTHGGPQDLGSSFGTAASAYAEHRPDYAREAVRWALAAAPGPRVLDRVRAYLGGRPETARGEFALPMLTSVLRVRRL